MKNNDDNNELSFWDKFKIYYKNIPGVRSLVKLGGYFIYFFVVIIILFILALASGLSKNNNKQDTTEIKYQDVLDKLLDNSSYTANITINGTKYIVTGEYGNNILTGTYESTNGVIKYKIKDNAIYEIKMDEEIFNQSLFGDINYNILLNDKLVNTITKAAGIKIDGEKIIYKYENINIDGTSYNIEVTIENNKINKILLTNDTITYDIVYN